MCFTFLKERFSLVTCGSSAGNTFSYMVKTENSNTKELIYCCNLVQITKDTQSMCAHLCSLLISTVSNTLIYTDNQVINCCGKQNTLHNSKVI